MKKKKLIKVSISLIILIAVLAITYKIMNSRTFQIMGSITNRVNTESKIVVLTFDDGPTDKTEEILKILNKNNIKATFYVIGEELEKNLDKGKLIVENGNELGNHTYSHNRNVFKSPQYIKSELNKTNELIKETGYDKEITFRPPFGKKLVILPYYLKKYNMNSITWDVEPDSFYEKAEDKVSYTLKNVKPGSIILLHPMHNEESLKALDNIITGLKEKGYEFVTVSELLKVK